MKLGQIAKVNTANLPVISDVSVLQTENCYYCYRDGRCIGTIRSEPMTDMHGRSRVYTIKKLGFWCRTLREAVDALKSKTLGG